MCLTVSGVCQQSSPDSNSSSPDPKDLLLAAAHTNGLARPNLAPWHIKISFESKDGHGRPLLQGTFEELWAGPDKYKRIFATSNFNQVEYLTRAGIRRTGSPDSAPSELTEIADQFIHPIPMDEDSINAAKLQMGEPSAGGAKLVCVVVSQPPKPATAIQAFFLKGSASNETYCTDEHSPILRIQASNSRNSRYVRNSIIKFQDCYLPQAVEEYVASVADQKPTLTAKLEKIESFSSIDDAQFTPPADAVPPPKVITLDARETSRRLLHHPYPGYDFMYPGEHRSTHLAGFVIIALRIHTDGHVSNLRVVGGTQEMRQVSLDAVRNWTYRPFTLNGEPVEVDTTAFLDYPLTR
jgi:hypothetical protein